MYFANSGEERCIECNNGFIVTSNGMECTAWDDSKFLLLHPSCTHFQLQRTFLLTTSRHVALKEYYDKTGSGPKVGEGSPVSTSFSVKLVKK